MAAGRLGPCTGDKVEVPPAAPLLALEVAVVTTPELVITDVQVLGAPRASTVSVTDGRITSVSDARAADLAGPGTEVVRGGGATLLPGFTDAHVHPLPAGVHRLTCDLSGVAHSVREYQDAVAAYARAHQDSAWVSGNGWYGDAFDGGAPHRELLDGVVADRPVVLVSHDGHGAWANSRALALAGIEDETPDPVGGRIERDAAGRATGVLVERAADLVTDLLPPISDAFAERALLEAQSHLHSLGVTGWQDACVGPIWGLPDPLPVYRRLAASGQLTARVVGALWWEVSEGLAQVDSLVERRAASTVGRFRATSVKVMQDGVCENCTGAMLRPYSGPRSHASPSGTSFLTPEELAEVCTRLDSLGFPVHLHAVGDRAVRECLDALEVAGRARARLGGVPLPGPHQLAHLDVVHPDDVPRFAQLGAVANLQALWARRDREIVERKLPLLGTEREAHHFPFADLHRAGAQLAMGSDWPVTDPNPLWAIYTAVHRLAPAQDPHGTGPEARTVPLEPAPALDLPTALRAYTLGSARANGVDHEVGSIEVGKLADLVLLDRPVLSGESGEELSAARPVLTTVGGEVVHRAG